jgi:hypothetical protein
VLIVENFLSDPAYVARLRELGYPLWRTLPPNQVFVRRDLLEARPWTTRLRDWLQSG